MAKRGLIWGGLALGLILICGWILLQSHRVGSEFSTATPLLAPPPPPQPAVVASAPPLAAAAPPAALQHPHFDKHQLAYATMSPEMAAPPPAPAPTATPAAPAPWSDAQFGQLVQGNAVWKAPAKMTEGDTSPVGITIGPNAVDSAALQAALQGMVSTTQNMQSGGKAVDVSPHMTATLSGAGFDISPPGPQPQLVSATAPTSWSWQATATASGAKFLTVTLAAELAGGERVTTLNEPIEVDVKALTVQQRLDATVAMLTSVKSILLLLAAICGIIFGKPVIAAVRRLFGKQPANQAKPPAG